MKAASFLLLLGICGLAHEILAPVSRAQSQATPPADAKQAVTPPTAPDETVTIPGPLRSFLRMSGLSLAISAQDVLPLLAHNVVLHGYQMGRPTEYLILVRRYVEQSRELTGLAAQNAALRVNGCKDAQPLLRALGYKELGECGKKSMSLVTADPERAFLTIDSGFPLLELEEALQRDAPFNYGYAGSSVPALFQAADWLNASASKGEPRSSLLESLLYREDVARLYWAMSRIEPETRAILQKNIGLANLLPAANTLDLYGSQLCIRDGAVLVPGGKAAEKEWQGLVGASPRNPAEFVSHLLTKDHGWLAAYYDALARTNQSQQAHFATGQRIKNYYAAFRYPGTSADASARVAFRPAPALMVLVTRMQWDANGDPYVPGNVHTWGEIFRAEPDSRPVRGWLKHSGSLQNPNQLAEALFVSARTETDFGPVQAYLCLSELDRQRGSVRRLSPGVVFLMAQKYADFSDQYLIFNEFPELNDDAIIHFLNTAESLGKISDHTLRGNAMGIFQANVGLWQILARQGQIDAAQLNSSWTAVIQPFAHITSDTQLVTAGRASLGEVFQATGKPAGSEEELIDLLAGAHQTSTEGQQMHREIAARMRAVVDDQRLIYFDTLFALDDGLKKMEQGGNVNKQELEALAGELREFEMPRPIFTSSERNRWAAGTYNNRHTEQQMKTDVAKVIKAPASPKQLEEARGHLATFLRDSLVGLNYAYYEPPNSQVLHHNPLFVRSHDFSGDTVIGAEHLWQTPRLFGAGSPAGGGAHLIGSLADLSYVLAETEQDFIAPDHVQALIWQQFVPGLLSNAVVPRWWNVTRNEVHAVALYQRSGEQLLVAAAGDEGLRGKVLTVLSDRMVPERSAWLEETLRAGNTAEVLAGIFPSDSFYLASEFRQKYPADLRNASAAARELDALNSVDPKEVNLDKLSHDFGVLHPVFAQSYGRELINVRPFPALGGNYSRLMGECWESGNLYWARLADEMGYSPVELNRMVPDLTRRMVERIAASELEDWPATLRALHETGDEVREGKISWVAGAAQARN
ncbi:MAG TPA: hypothetical protein VMU53_15585 [Candidatus Sulfotelmatobacter sp.]|nr:hypothetical protein [Candidatus Sulfotelmatobacter sp.]